MAQLDFDIITNNAKSLGDEHKQKKIFNYMKKKTSSNALVMIQETHSTRMKEQLRKYQWGGAMFFSHDTSDSRGVLVAVKNELEYKILSQLWLIVVEDILSLTLFSMGGAIMPPYGFSLISPERLELRPSNFLTFSFYLLAIRKIEICYF